jgi:hypothetical protein
VDGRAAIPASPLYASTPALRRIRPRFDLLDRYESTCTSPRLPAWHVYIYGECRRVGGRGQDAKKTTRECPKPTLLDRGDSLAIAYRVDDAIVRSDENRPIHHHYGRLSCAVPPHLSRLFLRHLPPR